MTPLNPGTDQVHGVEEKLGLAWRADESDDVLQAKVGYGDPVDHFQKGLKVEKVFNLR